MVVFQALSVQVKEGLASSYPASCHALKEVFYWSGGRFGHFARPTFSPAVTHVV